MTPGKGLHARRVSGRGKPSALVLIEPMRSSKGEMTAAAREVIPGGRDGEGRAGSLRSVSRG